MKGHVQNPWLRHFVLAFLSVLPIFSIVVILYFAKGDADFSLASDFSQSGYPYKLLGFILSSVLVAFGLGLFSLGVESISRIGSIIGESLTKKGNFWLFVILTFVIGFLVTAAEPDLLILATESGINATTLILVVAVGVGLFLVLGSLRIIRQWNLNVIFLAVYALIFMVANLAPENITALAFDAGGITTGAVTIPFVLAFGSAIAMNRAGTHSGSDDFGLVAHASIGPILALLIFGIFGFSNSLSFSPISLNVDFSASSTASAFLTSMKNVAIALVPLALFFLAYELLFVHLRAKELTRIGVGLLFCFAGLVIFLAAVQVGFSPIASSVGSSFGDDKGLPFAALIGAVFGCFAVLVEPAVAVLVAQIGTASEGAIKKLPFLLTIAISIGGAVALSVIRAYYGFSIMWYLVPGYILALLLTFLVPKIYTSIAFDAGTVASGPVAASFTMPFVIGFASSYYQSQGLSGSIFSTAIYQNAFGVIAMISLAPIIVVQLVGLYVETKRKISYAHARRRFVLPDDDQIIHFNEEVKNYGK